MRVLITGGSRGIGLAIANQFKSKGHSVYCPTREELDLSKPIILNDIEFDIVINNAGINPLKNILDISDDEVMRVNYFAPLTIIQHCLPYMIAQNFGRIINIGSIWIDIAKSKRAAYATSKNALHALTKALTAEYAQHNILSNTISPGFIATEMTFQNNTIEDINKIIYNIPLGRMGKPEEVADIVYFLSVYNTFISGQNLVIDGGFTCTTN